MLNYGAYEYWIQSRLVQAEYWHDPLVSFNVERMGYSALLVRFVGLLKKQA